MLFSRQPIRHRLTVTKNKTGNVRLAAVNPTGQEERAVD